MLMAFLSVLSADGQTKRDGNLGAAVLAEEPIHYRSVPEDSR